MEGLSLASQWVGLFGAFRNLDHFLFPLLYQSVDPWLGIFGQVELIGLSFGLIIIDWEQCPDLFLDDVKNIQIGRCGACDIQTLDRVLTLRDKNGLKMVLLRIRCSLAAEQHLVKYIPNLRYRTGLLIRWVEKMAIVGMGKIPQGSAQPLPVFAVLSFQLIVFAPDNNRLNWQWLNNGCVLVFLSDFLTLLQILFDFLIHSHLLSAQNLELFPQNIEPFLEVIQKITSLGKICANHDFGPIEVLFVYQGRNDFLLRSIRQFVAMNYFFVHRLLLNVRILEQNRRLYLLIRIRF